jgi:hypothetical protein
MRESSLSYRVNLCIFSGSGNFGTFILLEVVLRVVSASLEYVFYNKLSYNGGRLIFGL